jgi:cytochrome c-type biogenesis protein CcmE
MPRAKQYIAIAKLASNIAYFQTIAKYRQALDDLLEAMRTSGLDDVQRGVLERGYNVLKEEFERFKEERQIYKDYNETIAGVLSEAEREKLNIIINDDGTDSYFNDSTENQDKKEMYLPTSEEKE